MAYLVIEPGDVDGLSDQPFELGLGQELELELTAIVTRFQPPIDADPDTSRLEAHLTVTRIDVTQTT